MEGAEKSPGSGRIVDSIQQRPHSKPHPIRYGRMMQSPSLLSCAAAIMAADLAITADVRNRVQACGDCHLMNFGGFGTPERRNHF